MRGKGAMIWKLRDWAGGDPQAQVADAKLLKLDHVSIKMVDGYSERWEGSNTRQNADLLPQTVPALRAEGIAVKGWGYTYGVNVQREADVTIAVCEKHDLHEYDIDAEREYNRAGMGDEADLLARTLTSEITSVSLCSYRWPTSYQPAFPVEQFAPYMDLWTPQVYFIGDLRVNGGALQLEQSKQQYDKIRVLPFAPVAPTYRSGDWHASAAQLTAFFERARSLGCQGVSVWALEQATAEQRKAIAAFEWEPSSLPTCADMMRAHAAELRKQADELDALAGECG